MERMSPERRAEIEQLRLRWEHSDDIRERHWSSTSTDLLAELRAVEEENTALREALGHVATVPNSCPLCIGHGQPGRTVIHLSRLAQNALAKFGGETHGG